LPSKHLFDQYCDHPLIIELNYLERGWPENVEQLWHRDIWEKSRYESILYSANKKVDKEWLQTYEHVTEMNRLSALIEELLNLLTLFSNHRFFNYSNNQSWFIEPAGDITNIRLGQPWIAFDDLKRKNQFTNPDCAPIPTISTAEYFSHHREVSDVSGNNHVELAENTPKYFDFYFDLGADEKTKYYTACKLYNDALKLNSSNPSLSLIASVMAIESLVPTEQKEKCTACNAGFSVEKCEECGLPRHRVVSKFKDTVKKYAGDGRRKLAARLYSERSKLAHGGLLRDDLFDSGFYSKTADEQQDFRRQSLILVRDVVLNWLIMRSQQIEDFKHTTPSKD
jgi:hypothetical protein